MKVIHIEKIKGWMRSYLLGRLYANPLRMDGCFTEVAMFERFEQWTLQNLTSDDIEGLTTLKKHLKPHEFQNWLLGVFSDGGTELPDQFFFHYGEHYVQQYQEAAQIYHKVNDTLETALHSFRTSDETDPKDMN